MTLGATSIRRWFLKIVEISNGLSIQELWAMLIIMKHNGRKTIMGKIHPPSCQDLKGDVLGVQTSQLERRPVDTVSGLELSLSSGWSGDGSSSWRNVEGQWTGWVRRRASCSYGMVWYGYHTMVWYGMVWWQLSAPTDLLIAQLPDGSPKSPKCPINCSSPNYLRTVRHSHPRKCRNRSNLNLNWKGSQGMCLLVRTTFLVGNWK